MSMTSRQPDAKSFGETLLAFPAARERLPVTSAFRSTWIVASLLSIREAGLFDRYDAALEGAFRPTITESLAGTWLPIEVCLAHYRALDSLGLSRNQERDLASRDIQSVKATAFSFVSSLAKESGATPWTVFTRLNRVWERSFQGGAIAVHKQAPKDAVLEVAGWSCATIPYVRRTMLQVALSVTELFCRKAYVADMPTLWSPTSMGIKVSWA